MEAANTNSGVGREGVRTSIDYSEVAWLGTTYVVYVWGLCTYLISVALVHARIIGEHVPAQGRGTRHDTDAIWQKRPTHRQHLG